MKKPAGKQGTVWVASTLLLTVGLLIAACTSSVPPRQSVGASPQSATADQPTSGLGQSDSEAEATVSARANQIWRQMTLPEQAASVLMLHYPGTNAAAAQEFVEAIQPGGIILLGNNIPPVETQLIGYLEAVNEVTTLPLIIAVDQEGGTVSRLVDDPAPGPADLRDGDPQITKDAFRARAEYLRSLGINTNLGIVADVTEDPDAFIRERTLGTTPDQATSQVSAAVEGEKGLVLSTVKHFPGHGATMGDSHTSIPASELAKTEWLTNVAPPFQGAIAADVELVMMGHLQYGNIDPEGASLSPGWHRILREDLAFQGVIISDDMQMLRNSGDSQYSGAVANAVAALNAGTTMVLDIGSPNQDATSFAQDLIAGIVASVESGELSEKTLREAGLRLLEMRIQIGDFENNSEQPSTATTAGTRS